MKFAAWCELEYEAMAGLPLTQRCLYMELRWAMDHKTGLVGDSSRISYSGLAQRLYVEPARGRVESGSPSVSALRNAIEGLEKAGLVERVGNGDWLILRLKLAAVSARPKNKRQVYDRDLDACGKQTQAADFIDKNGIGKSDSRQGEKRLSRHISEDRVNHPFVEATAACLPPVDNFSKAELLLLGASEMAEMLNALEARRGKLARVQETDARVLGWESKQVTARELGAAYRMAVADREVTKNPSPINAGFVDVKLFEVLKGRGVCRESGAESAAHWFGAAAGVEAMAKRFGVVRDAGESDVAFKFRVNAVVGEAEKQRWAVAC